MKPRLCAAILKLAALLAPRESRLQWLAEWRSELWYFRQEHSTREALLFCFGAFADALWLRRNHVTSPSGAWLRSPVKCLLFLAAPAAVAITLFVHTGGVDPVLGSFREPRLVFGNLFMIGVAVMLLCVTTSVSLGEYPPARSSPAHARRLYRRAFLCLKFALMLPIVFCGTFDAGRILSASGVQPHAALIGYVIAFRWVLKDQRQRCPVCLRLLAQSAKIGEFSHNFLEWYGTELFCSQGHGLLHVPNITTTYDTQRWLDLDRSWDVLFARASKSRPTFSN